MNARQVWQATLGDLQAKIGREDFNLLANASIVGVEEQTVQVGVANDFTANWLERKLTDEVSNALGSILGYQVDVLFVLRQTSDGVTTGLYAPPGNSATDGERHASEQQRNLPPERAPGYQPRSTFSDNRASTSKRKVSNMGRNSLDDEQDSRPNYPQTSYSGYNTYASNGSGSRTSTNAEGYRNGNSNASSGEGYRNGNGNGNSNTRNGSNDGYRAPMRRPRFGEGSRQMELSMDESQLNQRYVFEDFIVGSSNRFAHAASIAVADSPGRTYNPLFLYGGVGLGKTHLLHAIGNRVLQNNPNARVLYVSSERFTNELINAIGERRTEEFRARYRTIDVLMIDDIQFIAGKESTQEEFFHTFNTLHQSMKQIVISSDKPPKAILTLEDRLRSRFEGGLIADVQTPDFETRIAILRAKAQQQQHPVPGEVIEFVARRVQSNIRELEGALTRVIAYAGLNNANLTEELAAEALNDLSISSRRRSITPARVIEIVSSFYNIEVTELKGKSRSREVVLPRQVAMYIIREETETSLSEIGDAFGGKDHTTVMHSCEKIERSIEADSSLRQEVLTLRQHLYNETKP